MIIEKIQTIYDLCRVKIAWTKRLNIHRRTSAIINNSTFWSCLMARNRTIFRTAAPINSFPIDFDWVDYGFFDCVFSAICGRIDKKKTRRRRREGATSGRALNYQTRNDNEFQQIFTHEWQANPLDWYKHWMCGRANKWTLNQRYFLIKFCILNRH